MAAHGAGLWGLFGGKWRRIPCGFEPIGVASFKSVHVLASDGTVYTCPASEAVGAHDIAVALRPEQQTEGAIAISAGKKHATHIDVHGVLYSWGSFSHGRLGLGKPSSFALGSHRSPVRVPKLSAQRVVQVSCGLNFAAACTNKGDVYSWGYNSSGKLGLGDAATRFHPTQVAFPGRAVCIAQVSCGWSHSAAISTSGHLFTWGKGQHGRLGHGTQSDLPNPRRVGDSLAAQTVVDVSCGACHTAAVTAHGLVFTFGHGAEGRLGHGHCLDQTTPTAVATLLDRRTVSAFAGRSCTIFFVLASDGDDAAAASSSPLRSPTRPHGDESDLRPCDVHTGIAAPRSVYRGPRNATAEVMGASDARRMASSAPDVRQPIDTFYSGFLPGVRRTSVPATTAGEPDARVHSRGMTSTPQPATIRSGSTESVATATPLGEPRLYAPVGDSAARGGPPASEPGHDADTETIVESGGECGRSVEPAAQRPSASERAVLTAGPGAEGGSTARRSAAATHEWRNPALLPTPLLLPQSASVFQVSLVDNGMLCLARPRDQTRDRRQGESDPRAAPAPPPRPEGARPGGTCAPPVTPQTPCEAQLARRRDVAAATGAGGQGQGLEEGGSWQTRSVEGQAMGAEAAPPAGSSHQPFPGSGAEGAAAATGWGGGGGFADRMDRASTTATAAAAAATAAAEDERGGVNAVSHPSFLYSTSTTQEGGSSGHPSQWSASDAGDARSPPRRPHAHTETGTGSASASGSRSGGEGPTTASDSGSARDHGPQRAQGRSFPRAVPGHTDGGRFQGPTGHRPGAGQAAARGGDDGGRSRGSASSSQKSSDHAQSVDGDIASSGSADSGRWDALRVSGGHSSASWGSSADAERIRSRGRHQWGRRSVRTGTVSRSGAMRDQQGAWRAARTRAMEAQGRPCGPDAPSRRRVGGGGTGAYAPQPPPGPASADAEAPPSPNSLPPLVHSWEPSQLEAPPGAEGGASERGRLPATISSAAANASRWPTRDGGSVPFRPGPQAAEPRESSHPHLRRRRKASRSRTHPPRAGLVESHEDASLHGGSRGDGPTSAQGGWARSLPRERVDAPRQPSHPAQRSRAEEEEEERAGGGGQSAADGVADTGFGGERAPTRSAETWGRERGPMRELALSREVMATRGDGGRGGGGGPGPGADCTGGSLTASQEEVVKLRADLAELRDQHNRAQSSLRRQEMEADQMRAKLARSRHAWLVVCRRYRELTLANAQLRGHAQASREARVRLGDALIERSSSVLGRAPTQQELGTHSLGRQGGGEPPRALGHAHPRMGGPQHGAGAGLRHGSRVRARDASLRVDPREEPPVSRRRMRARTLLQEAQILGRPAWNAGEAVADEEGAPVPAGESSYAPEIGTLPYSGLGATFLTPHGHGPAGGGGEERRGMRGTGDDQLATSPGRWWPSTESAPRDGDSRGRALEARLARWGAQAASPGGAPSGEPRFVEGSISGSGQESMLSMGVAVSRLHENQAHGMEAVEWNRGVGPRGAGPGRARSVARCERPHWYRGDARAGRPEGSNFPDAFVDSNTLLLMHDQAYRSNLDARRAQGSAPRAVDLAPDGAATMSFYGPLQVRGRQHEARLGADLLD